MEISEELAWKESFFTENFNVDQCLSKYTLKSDLETLRNDLKTYGNELHQQMAEILKTETEAIVNLAEYLTNLSSKIDDLSLPISQLREEIKTLYDLIKNVETYFFTTLETIKTNSATRNYLNQKFGIISSAMYIDKMLNTQEDGIFDDSLILERAVNKFSFEYNYLEALDLASDIQEISKVGRKLTEMVNRIFLNAIKNNDRNVILRSLRMYENLGQQFEAEKTYQVNVIRPALKHLFSETHLESCDQEVSKVYDEALNFADTKTTLLVDILKANPELKSYNFILNSFWVEVDKQSREGLPYITAPGNPELFQKRFKSTWAFLTSIAQRCGDEDLIYKHASFQDHIKRFNLPVYFEIRFQQIAGQFEGEAVSKPNANIYTGSNEIDCKLKITAALWRALLRCFHEEVFIENLADQFLKLSMLLLARYLKWFEVALQECDTFTEGSLAWDSFIINGLNDINIINNLIGEKADVDRSVYKIMPAKVQPVLSKFLEINSSTIGNVTKKLKEHLISIKSSESLAHLQNVAAIPRLYRRTNRSAPKEPSQYIHQATAPILHFHEMFATAAKVDVQNILDSVITNITRQYLTLVEEVLRSVCKTEESLRRLKNRSNQISEVTSDDLESSATMSDEMKIREQIKADVFYFIDNLYRLALDEGKRAMDELKRQTC